MVSLRTYILTIVALVIYSNLFAQSNQKRMIPKDYICYRSSSKIIIDGLINEKDWHNAAWTDAFIDIEGNSKPKPRFETKAKMLWDDNYLYIAAYLEEPHVWANLTERESIIFYDNDFEVFIDPDGDTHKYLEFEMNALNTQWDLLLLKPYRDESGGTVAIDNWSFNGIHSAVHIDGTLNNPNDIDKGWSLEIAIPLDAITEVGSTGPKPVNNEKYRINFSRVEWNTDVVEGKYVKRKTTEKGIEKNLPEDNWVWSEQGNIAMHQPETWGYLQFSNKVVGSATQDFIADEDAEISNLLRNLYYKQSAYCHTNKKYTELLASLFNDTEIHAYENAKTAIYSTPSFYEATALSTDGKRIIHISQDGRLWKTNANL